MAGCKLPLTGVALCVIVTGLVFHTIGMATPDWTVYSHSERGPYTACDSVSCGEASLFTEDASVDAVRGLTMTAMVLGVLACIATVLICCKPDAKILPAVSAILCVFAFLLILIAIIIWAADVHDELADIGYSFVLSIVGGIIMLVGGVIVLIAGRAH